MASHDDLAKEIRKRLDRLDDQIAELACERDTLENALEALEGVRTDERTLGTNLASHSDMPNRAKINDARIPGGWVPHELLDRIRAVVGKRALSTFIREAMEREIDRREVRSGVRTRTK